MIKMTLSACCGAILALGSFFFINDRIRVEEKEEYQNVMLNKELTNEMSDIESLKGLDNKMKTYMQTWELKGMSLAITRGDSLVYAKGYGWADEEKQIEMTPGELLRLASVSKLITACGIMKLQEESKLSLSDKVFGSEGILDEELYNSVLHDTTHYGKITVEHLLRHQGGFNRDPLFSSLDVKNQLMLNHAPEYEDFVRLVLGNKLSFEPGTSQRYSNFGYLLLSKIIEKVSGEPYEQYLNEHVLKPAGCLDMHICNNYFEEKYPNETRYYTHNGDGKIVEEYNGSGKMVERCYGGNNIKGLLGAGAWCASTIEMARLVSSIDNDPDIPDILSEESINLMTRYIDENTYSLGWNDTDPQKGWSRTGTYSGTSALVRKYPDGECWILVTNTSTWKGPSQSKYTSTLFTQCRELYSEKLPHRNMFRKAVNQEDIYFNY